MFPPAGEEAVWVQCPCRNDFLTEFFAQLWHNDLWPVHSLSRSAELWEQLSHNSSLLSGHVSQNKAY